MDLQKGMDTTLQLVGFRLGDEEFAIDIQNVQEINNLVEITPMPKSPDFIEGIINLRGRIVPVIDLRKRFDFPSVQRTAETKVVVVSIDGKMIGLLVDGVSEVIRINSESVDPPPPMVSSVESDYISGVGKLGGRLIVLLDLRKVFSIAEMHVLEADKNETDNKTDNVHSAPVSLQKPVVVEEMRKQEKVAIEDVAPGITAKEPASEPKKAEVASPKEDEEDIKKLVEMTKAMSEGDFYKESSMKLHGEIGKLADYINKTRKSLQLLNPSIAASSENIPMASEQLSDITRATEEATHKVLGLAEKIMSDQEVLSGELAILKEIAATHPDASTELLAVVEKVTGINNENQNDLVEIMTSLSFQDLTGQKIKKIVTLVSEVEAKLLELIVAFGIDPEKAKEKSGKTEMLQQIQESSKKGAVSQDLVDDILNEFFN